MALDRRRFIAASAALAAAVPLVPDRANASPHASAGIDASQLGVQPGSTEDQTGKLQAAIDRAARARRPLLLGPGIYRAGGLRLPAGAQLTGVRGATRLVLTRGPSLLLASQADDIALWGLTLDGAGIALPGNGGLVQLAACKGIRIADCAVLTSGGHGIALEGVEGEVAGCTVEGAAAAGIFSLDARGLAVRGNTVRGSANNGIQVWRSSAGDDGTLVIDNRIEDTAAKAGGSGQNGNAINVYRAGNVTVRGNRIRGAAFSAVRGNAASNLAVLGNTCTGLGEVAIYAEFGFEGAVIANNLIDGAAIGISVTNFNEGGRMAVVQGNVIRNLVPFRPAGTDPGDAAGVGIGVEADTAVTGNVIENAPAVGIIVGWQQHLRDVTVTGNVVRDCGVGIGVSVAAGAGAALIADNLVSGARRGAVIGMNGNSAVTGELANDGARAFAHLTISGNRMR